MTLMPQGGQCFPNCLRLGVRSQALLGTTSIVNLVHEPPERSTAVPASPIHHVQISPVLLAGVVPVVVKAQLVRDRVPVVEVPQHVGVDHP